ncbi:MAG: NepR family anti-sigma factor [Terricaulis sp.]
MRITDDVLMAFADGELPAEEAERIEAMMRDDREMAARVTRFRSVRSALRAAYDSVAQEPIPDRLRALLHDVEAAAPSAPEPSAAPIVHLSAERERRRFSAPTWAAIAAGLVVAVLAGRMSTPDSLFVGEAGHLHAGGQLTRVLDTRLASAPENANDDIRVGLTFRTAEGDVCRTFTGNGDDGGVSGLACHEANDWAIRIAAATPASDGEYRQAGAETVVMDMVDALIAGEPLDAAQEQAARDNHWGD